VNRATLQVISQDEIGPSSPIILDKEKRPTPGLETEERLRQIALGLGRFSRVSFLSAEVADEQLDATLGAVHAREYLDFLSHWSKNLELGQIHLDEEHRAPGVDADTPIVAGAYGAAREAARSAIAAAQEVTNGKLYSYALCRPPGHHAGHNWLGGYCYLNNAVVAVRTLLNAGMSRVGVIDFDYHFGNGSASLLERVSEVFYGSIHSSTEISFPYMKTQPPNSRQVYVPFRDLPEPAEFLRGITRLLEESLAFGSEAMVVSVGYDIVADDPHGTWSLPPSVLQEVGRQLAITSVPLCCVQEGGYLLSKLEECAYQFSLGLLGESDD